MIKNISELGADVQELAKGISIIEFFTEDCVPCKTMAETLESICEEDHSITMLQIDAEKDEEYTKIFGIMGVPAVFLFKDGEFKEGFTGILPKHQLKEKIRGL
jgi:thioredoxin 1